MRTSDTDPVEQLLETVRKQVNTLSYQMSIGEVAHLYKDDELNLQPGYQRYFRWNDVQKSKLIESVLIGLPLPTFFMYQDDAGIYEVVDGMQRLSTLFDFMGILKQSYQEKCKHYARFERLSDDLFYIGNRNSGGQDTFSGKSWQDLPTRIQMDFKRTPIYMTILLRTTSKDAKFELFQRLNTGGTDLSGQELRNAILVSENPPLLTLLENLAHYEAFKTITGLSEAEKKRRFDMDLVLRFIILLDNPQPTNIRGIEVYLTRRMREINQNKQFDYVSCKKIFKRTCDLISDAYGKAALKYEKGKFSIARFETTALGIAQNIKADNSAYNKEMLREKIQQLAEQKTFQDHSKPGISTQARLRKLLAFGKDYFKPS